MAWRTEDWRYLAATGGSIVVVAILAAANFGLVPGLFRVLQVGPASASAVQGVVIPSPGEALAVQPVTIAAQPVPSAGRAGVADDVQGPPVSGSDGPSVPTAPPGIVEGTTRTVTDTVDGVGDAVGALLGQLLPGESPAPAQGLLGTVTGTVTGAVGILTNALTG